LLIQGPISAPI